MNGIINIINSELKLTIDHFDYSSVGYDSQVVGSNIKSNINNKADLIAVLSQTENWDAERLRTHFDVEVENEPSLAVVRLKLSYIHDYTLENMFWRMRNRTSLEDLTKNRVSNHMESANDAITRLEKNKLRSGMKITKNIRKCLDELFILGDYTQTRKDAINKLYQELSDEIGTRGTKKIRFYLGVGYYDFMRMSRGNSWGSCHNLEDGCHSQGCLSYADDSTSMLLYSESRSDNRELVNRVHTLGLHDKIMFGRIYGDDFNEDIFGLVASQLAEQLGDTFVTDKWGSMRYYNAYDGEIQIDTRGNHYPDYDSWSQHVFEMQNTIFSRPDEYNRITIGNHGLCLKCGDDVDTDSCMLECEECNDQRYCNRCDEYHHLDDMVITGYGREHVCINCAVFCEDCGDWELPTNSQHIHGEWYCNSCVENFSTCDDCVEYIVKGDEQYTNDGVYCPDCFENHLDELEEDEE